MAGLSRLGEGYWVVAFDQRGYGEFFKLLFCEMGFWREGKDGREMRMRGGMGAD